MKIAILIVMLSVACASQSIYSHPAGLDWEVVRFYPANCSMMTPASTTSMSNVTLCSWSDRFSVDWYKSEDQAIEAANNDSGELIGVFHVEETKLVVEKYSKHIQQPDIVEQRKRYKKAQ